MSETSQRIVVIHYASKDLTTSAINWALHGLSLEPGDELTVVAILHHVNSPSRIPFIAPARLRNSPKLFSFPFFILINFYVL